MSAALTTVAGKSSIAIDLPTALIYEKLKAKNAPLASMYVGYVGHNVLVGTSYTLAAPIVVAAETTTTGNYDVDVSGCRR